MSTNPGPNELFSTFYEEVKAIEKRDSVLTPKQQIDRLNRPGSTYFNLNPYDVLQVDPDAAMADIKKKYRQLSLLVHPDKNPDDIERSQKAFEAVNKAYKTLDDPETSRKCKEVVEEAKDLVEQMMVEKRKRVKKTSGSITIEEDDPEKRRHAIYVQTCKLFADLERLRVEEEQKQCSERKRKAEEEEEGRKLMAYDKEWKKNYEESRVNRVASWRDFKAKKSKTSKGIGGLKPPKTKMEQRPG
ncbi:DnaJ (Hsp40), sub C, member 8 [Schistosoma haematobium]|uniref:DnaJ (Hsp40), sub C, member 8 n=4 Tax=Schistosoma haematobium TaxID=6185 RepID=A0A922LM72_SCHHA|nr:DnaJ (Hsp40), sub C, member 8 [Schistosoma haematobium]KAH9589723.1 DnaJ (Hsp40), sub C, member 8 [Schistosoma haematobium]